MAASMKLSNTCNKFKLPCKMLNLLCFKSQIHTTSHNFVRRRRGVQLKDSVSTNTDDGTLSSSSQSSGKWDSKDNSTPTGTGINMAAHRSSTRVTRPRVPEQEHHRRNFNNRSSSKIREEDNVTGEIPRYDKAVASDKRLGRAMMLTRSRKYREQTGKIILEGRRLIEDALQAGAKADTIFFSQVSNIEGLPHLGSRVNLVKVAYKDIKLWSELGTPQGIVGVFRQPSYDNLSLDDGGSEGRLPVTMICDNIRDPGNLGTILRSAAAAACHKVLVSKGCVDVWEPKVLRSGAGAHFRVPIISNIPWSSIPNFLDQEGSVHIADCKHNLSENEHRVHPCETSEGKEISQANQSSDDDMGLPAIVKHRTSGDEETALGTVPYLGVNWVANSCALVIGGETEGLSKEAKDLCANTDGRRVYIPMSMGVDSLNAAMATSIILFEAKRQFITVGDKS